MALDLGTLRVNIETVIKGSSLKELSKQIDSFEKKQVKTAKQSAQKANKARVQELKKFFKERESLRKSDFKQQQRKERQVNKLAARRFDEEIKRSNKLRNLEFKRIDQSKKEEAEAAKTVFKNRFKLYQQEQKVAQRTQEKIAEIRRKGVKAGRLTTRSFGISGNVEQTQEAKKALERFNKVISSNNLTVQRAQKAYNGLNTKLKTIKNNVGPAVKQVNGFTKVLRGSSRAASTLLGPLDGTAFRLRSVAIAVENNSGGFTRFAKTLGIAGTALTTIATIAATVTAALGAVGVAAAIAGDRTKLYNRQLNAVTESTAEFVEANSKLRDIAADIGAPLNRVINTFQTLSQVQSSLGASNDDIFETVETIERLGKVTGATPADLTRSITQLTQALSEGRVTARNFRSVLEATPGVAQAIAENFEGAGGSATQMLNVIKEGKVSSEGLLQAVLDINEAALKTKSTFREAGNALTQAFGEVGAEIDQITGLSDALTKAMENLAEGARGVAKEFDALNETPDTLGGLNRAIDNAEGNFFDLRKEIMSLQSRANSGDPIASFFIEEAREDLEKTINRLQRLSKLKAEISGQEVVTILDTENLDAVTSMEEALERIGGIIPGLGKEIKKALGPLAGTKIPMRMKETKEEAEDTLIPFRAIRDTLRETDRLAEQIVQRDMELLADLNVGPVQKLTKLIKEADVALEELEDRPPEPINGYLSRMAESAKSLQDAQVEVSLLSHELTDFEKRVQEVSDKITNSFDDFFANVVRNGEFAFDKLGDSILNAISQNAGKEITKTIFGEGGVKNLFSEGGPGGLISSISNAFSSDDVVGSIGDAFSNAFKGSASTFEGILQSAGAGLAGINISEGLLGGSLTNAGKGLGAAGAGIGAFFGGPFAPLTAGIGGALGGALGGTQEVTGGGIKLKIEGGKLVGSEFATVEESSIFGSSEFEKILGPIGQQLKQNLNSKLEQTEEVLDRVGTSLDNLNTGFEKIRLDGLDKLEKAQAIGGSILEFTRQQLEVAGGERQSLDEQLRGGLFSGVRRGGIFGSGFSGGADQPGLDRETQEIRVLVDVLDQMEQRAKEAGKEGVKVNDMINTLNFSLDAMRGEIFNTDSSIDKFVGKLTEASDRFEDVRDQFEGLPIPDKFFDQVSRNFKEFQGEIITSADLTVFQLQKVLGEVNKNIENFEFGDKLRSQLQNEIEKSIQGAAERSGRIVRDALGSSTIKDDIKNVLGDDLTQGLIKNVSDVIKNITDQEETLKEARKSALDLLRDGVIKSEKDLLAVTRLLVERYNEQKEAAEEAAEATKKQTEAEKERTQQAKSLLQELQVRSLQTSGQSRQAQIRRVELNAQRTRERADKLGIGDAPIIEGVLDAEISNLKKRLDREFKGALNNVDLAVQQATDSVKDLTVAQTTLPQVNKSVQKTFKSLIGSISEDPESLKNASVRLKNQFKQGMISSNELQSAISVLTSEFKDAKQAAEEAARAERLRNETLTGTKLQVKQLTGEELSGQEKIQLQLGNVPKLEELGKALERLDGAETDGLNADLKRFRNSLIETLNVTDFKNAPDLFKDVFQIGVEKFKRLTEEIENTTDTVTESINRLAGFDNIGIQLKQAAGLDISLSDRIRQQTGGVLNRDQQGEVREILRGVDETGASASKATESLKQFVQGLDISDEEAKKLSNTLGNLLAGRFGRANDRADEAAKQEERRQNKIEQNRRDFFQNQFDLIESRESKLVNLQQKRNRILNEEIDRINEQIDRQKEIKEAFNQASRSIKEFRQELLTSEQSPLSPGEQFAAAQQQFRQTLSAARGGDLSAIKNLEGVSQTFLDQAREQFGATKGFADVFDRVQSGLGATEETAKDQAKKAQQQIDLQREQIANVRESNAQIVALNQQISDLREQLADQREFVQNLQIEQVSGER